MTHDLTENYDDDRVLLKVEGEYQDFNITAYSCPDAEGRTFIAGGETEIGEVTKPDNYGAPFSVDIIIHDAVYPMEGEIQELREEIGESFAAQFEKTTKKAFDKIQDSDDPIEAIDEMTSEDLL